MSKAYKFISRLQDIPQLAEEEDKEGDHEVLL